NKRARASPKLWPTMFARSTSLKLYLAGRRPPGGSATCISRRSISFCAMRRRWTCTSSRKSRLDLMNDRHRILVVDDESQITRVLRTSLSSQGYDLRVANDGETALEI